MLAVPQSLNVRPSVGAVRLPGLLVAIIGLCVVYVSLAMMLPPGGFFIGDQGVKYTEVLALARGDGLTVGSANVSLNIFRPAFGRGLYAIHGEHFLGVFLEAYAALVLPFYQVLGIRGLVVPSLMGALLAVGAIGLIGAQVGVRRPWLLALAVGLASPFLFYAEAYWEHALAAALTTLGVYLALRARFFGAGLVVALAAWLRPDCYIFAPALGLGFVALIGLRSSLRPGLLFGLGYLLGIMPWWAFNQLSFGHFLGPEVAANAIPTASRLTLVAMFLLPAGRLKWLALLGLLAGLGAACLLIRRSFRAVLPGFWLGAAAISAYNLATHVIGPSLTDVYPFLFVALGALCARSVAPRVRFLMVVAVADALGVVFLAVTWGGGGWGPRLLLPVVPLLTIVAWLGLETQDGTLARFAATALLLLSLGWQIVGVSALARASAQWVRLDRELAALRPPVVATSLWWLPQVAAPTDNVLTWQGVANTHDMRILTTHSSTFWWVWSSADPNAVGTGALQQGLPWVGAQVVVVAQRDLGVRHLRATLCRVSSP